MIEGNQSWNQTQPRSICGCPSHFMTDCRWMISASQSLFLLKPCFRLMTRFWF